MTYTRRLIPKRQRVTKMSATATKEEPVLDQFRQAKKNMKDQLQGLHSKVLVEIQEVDEWFDKTNNELKKVGVDFPELIRQNIALTNPPSPETEILEITKKKRSGGGNKKQTEEKKPRVLTAEEQKILDFAKTFENGFTHAELVTHMGPNSEKETSVVTSSLVKLMHEGYLKDVTNEGVRRFTIPPVAATTPAATATPATA